MKKIFCIILSLCTFGIGALAKEGNSLEFEPAGGGQFIYCNNREELTYSDLADIGEDSSYIMSNRDLGEDNYRLFITHFARIANEEGYPGTDIFADAVFTAKSDTEIRLINTAFEIPQNREKYLNYEVIRSEDSWSSLWASADLLGKPIHLLKSDRVFEAEPEDEEVIILKKGERVFLSDYIENYEAVPYPKHVLMAADFEIVSGSCDIDVFAARKRETVNGKTTYPNVDFDKCAFGAYKYDRMVKGIAKTLPEMRAELEYTIDDTVLSGSSLPVRISNQYYPKSHEVTAWVTNLNPQSDAAVRILNAESSILAFEYKDPGKKDYYGKNIHEDERDDVWVFDTTRSDSVEYKEGLAKTEEDYVPNSVMTPDTAREELACNLGNHGVTLRYDLTVTNNGQKERFFDYVVTTSANVIVEVTDENGKDIAPVIARGQTNEQEKQVLASVPLPPGETTKFSISLTLPVQNYGGQRQAFVISDQKTEHDFSPRYDYEKDLIEPIAVKSNANYEELLKNADEKTKSIFEGSIKNWEIVPFNDGYAAYNAAISGSPYIYWNYWSASSKIILLDKDFNITGEIETGSQPMDMRSSEGRLYVITIADGAFSIDENLEKTPFDGYILPEESDEGVILLAKKARLSVSYDGEKYYQINFLGKELPFAKALDDGFYYAANGVLGVSKDGVYWDSYDAKALGEIDENLVAELIAKCDEDSEKLCINDEILALDINDGKVPLRTVFEKLNMQILSREGKITAVNSNRLLNLELGKTLASVNGEKIELTAPPELIDGKTYIAIEALSQLFSAELKRAEGCVSEINTEPAESVGDIEIRGDISAVKSVQIEEKEQ